MRVSCESNRGVHWTTLAVERDGDCDLLVMGGDLMSAYRVWPIPDDSWPADELCARCRLPVPTREEGDSRYVAG